MLVLNAPKFFSLSWGLIKKFIDPRTAQRIQVFSSEERGLKALQKMVDASEIPLDYGGPNKSVKQAFTEEAADPTLLRQEIQLLHVKRKHKTTSHTTWDLEKGEYMAIRVYTRSVSTSAITIRINGAIFKTVEVRCAFEEGEGEDASPMPNSVLAVARLSGPGKVSIEGQDLDNATKKQHGMSKGYFLIVGDVKATNQESG